ncbi:hypothetical protein SLE2022_034100 [Rubroshorea leprosula]
MENRLNETAPMSPAATTFVQADATTFRDLVQRLTGLASDAERLPLTLPSRTWSKPLLTGGDTTGPRRSPFKLQERRQHTLRKLEIKMGLTSLHDLSPPMTTRCRFESTTPSPVTPLSESLFFPSSGSESPSTPAVSEEERAIAEKGFYLHPSPLNTPRGSDPPELLTLFPLSSPRQETPP